MLLRHSKVHRRVHWTLFSARSHLHTHSLTQILILCSNLLLVISLFKVFQPKLHTLFLFHSMCATCPAYAIHRQYLVKNTNCEARHCAVFWILLSLPLTLYVTKLSQVSMQFCGCAAAQTLAFGAPSREGGLPPFTSTAREPGGNLMIIIIIS